MIIQSPRNPVIIPTFSHLTSKQKMFYRTAKSIQPSLKGKEKEKSFWRNE